MGWIKHVILSLRRRHAKVEGILHGTIGMVPFGSAQGRLQLTMTIFPRPKLVGILNVTPDSYFDGGKFMTVEVAVQRAVEMLSDGADIIEIGGESTGPKSSEVPVEEEIRRVIPIITAIKKAYPDAAISIDTWKSFVAAEAISAGATMINDVTAGRSDPKIFQVAAKAGAPLVLMFSKDSTPRTTVTQTQYDDVIVTIGRFLAERKQAAIAAGVDPAKIILDPGMGHFISSDPKYSFEVLARLRELESLGSPIFVSPSRKSFLAGSENLKTIDRLPGTIAASAIAVMNGATYIRTHDIKDVRRACEVAADVLNRTQVSW